MTIGIMFNAKFHFTETMRLQNMKESFKSSQRFSTFFWLSWNLSENKSLTKLGWVQLQGMCFSVSLNYKGTERTLLWEQDAWIGGVEGSR